jgi:hypothetical protein
VSKLIDQKSSNRPLKFINVVEYESAINFRTLIKPKVYEDSIDT